MIDTYKHNGKLSFIILWLCILIAVTLVTFSVFSTVNLTSYDSYTGIVSNIEEYIATYKNVDTVYYSYNIYWLENNISHTYRVYRTLTLPKGNQINLWVIGNNTYVTIQKPEYLALEIIGGYVLPLVCAIIETIAVFFLKRVGHLSEHEIAKYQAIAYLLNAITVFVTSIKLLLLTVNII